MAGEDRVGQILGALTAHGWLVLHGLQIGRTDIDHVLVGPGGVITIETKSRRGWTVVSEVPRRWLQQASAHRRRLLELVPVIGRADALLVLHAPTVGLGPVLKRGVYVLPAGGLRGHLIGLPTVMSEQKARATYDEIVRSVALSHMNRNSS